MIENKHQRFKRLHPLYSKWNNMKRRCHDKEHKDYPRYGGRGITISTDWMIFRNWERDMSPTYKAGLQQERIDNNLGYSLENCRWATAREQANNRRTNHMLTYKGITKTMQQWTRIIGIKQSTFAMRIRYGWDIDRIMNTSTGGRSCQ